MADTAFFDLISSNGIDAVTLFMLFKMSNTLKDVFANLERIKYLEVRLEKLEKDVQELRFILRKVDTNG